MLSILIYFFLIVVGALAGAGLGGLLPLLIATAEQGFRARFTDDRSASGFGFLVVFTTPAGFIGGLMLGSQCANQLIDSGEKLDFFSHGQGLVMLANYAVGVGAAIFMYVRFFR